MFERYLRPLAGTALLIAVCVVAWHGWRALDAPVEVVRISGELSEAERARATELVSLFLPAGVLSVDTRLIRELLERESWVDTVALWRKWPDGIQLEVRPEVAVARWRDGGLLSNRGRVIEPLELIGLDGLPHLSGPEGSAVMVMEAFQRVADVLRPHEIRIDALEMDDEGGIEVHVRQGPRVMLGRSDLSGRLQRLDLVLRTQFPDGLDDVLRIDTRYGNGIAVAWRDNGATASEQLAKRS